MNISDILSRNCVLAHVRASSKRELLEDLSARVAQLAKLDTHLVADSVWERENLGSTGYGNGTALPHARIEGLNEVRAVFAQLETPIDFQAVDKKNVDLVFLLISPENSGADHLSALATFSRILKNEDLCEKLRSAETSEDLCRLLFQNA